MKDRVIIITASALLGLVGQFIVWTVYLWPLFETYRQITVAGGGWVTP